MRVNGVPDSIFLDGVYVDGTNGSSTRFRWVKAPTSAELTQLTHTIARRVPAAPGAPGAAGTRCREQLSVRGWRGRRAAGSNSWATPSRIASRWARTRAARCSRCRPYRTAMSRSIIRWARWRDSRSPSECRGEGGRTQEVGTFVPLHCQASGVRKAPVAHRQWPCALRTQDAVPRWHHACHFRATGLHCPAGRLGAQAPGQLDSIPWCVRLQQRASCAGDAGQTG